MNKADVIKGTYLFRGIDASDLPALLGITEQTVLLPGQLAYDVDQLSDAIFIIEMGGLSTLSSKENKRRLLLWETARRWANWLFSSRTNGSLPLRPASARSLCGYLSISWGQLLMDRPALGSFSFTETLASFFAKHVRELGSERDRAVLRDRFIGAHSSMKMIRVDCGLCLRQDLLALFSG